MSITSTTSGNTESSDHQSLTITDEETADNVNSKRTSTIHKRRCVIIILVAVVLVSTSLIVGLYFVLRKRSNASSDDVNVLVNGSDPKLKNSPEEESSKKYGDNSIGNQSISEEYDEQMRASNNIAGGKIINISDVMNHSSPEMYKLDKNDTLKIESTNSMEINRTTSHGGNIESENSTNIQDTIIGDIVFHSENNTAIELENRGEDNVTENFIGSDNFDSSNSIEVYFPLDLISDDNIPTEIKLSNSGGNDNAEGIIHNGTFRTATTQPIQALLPTCSPSSLEKYTTCTRLREHIRNAASIIINREILSHAEKENNYYASEFNFGPSHSNPSPIKYKSSYSDTSPIKHYIENINNQNITIDEATFLKSTPNHTFYIYDEDKLLMWDTKSGELQSITLVKSGASIIDLLLHENCLLTVVVKIESSKELNTKIIQNDQSVHLMQYDIASISKDGTSPLSLRGTIELQGSYIDSKIIGKSLQVVSISGIDTYLHLTRHFNRGQLMYKGLNRDEYIKTAVEHAKSIIIPSFVDRLVDEIEDVNTCHDLLQMCMHQTVADKDTNVTLPNIGGIMQGLVDITTFYDDTKLETSSSLRMFIPNVMKASLQT